MWILLRRNSENKARAEPPKVGEQTVYHPKQGASGSERGPVNNAAGTVLGTPGHTVAYAEV